MPAVNTDEGTILEALNDKLDRDANNLDTSTTNFDVVVDYQIPTSENNYTWYRKYASGWVEQGGKKINADDMVTVDLPVTMADTNYFATKTITSGATSTAGTIVEFVAHLAGVEQKTVSSFKTKCWSSFSITEFYWEVKGMAAA